MKQILLIWLLTFNIPAFGQPIDYVEPYGNYTNNSRININSTAIGQNERPVFRKYYLPKNKEMSAKPSGQFELNSNAKQSRLVSSNSLHLLISQNLSSTKIQYIVELTNNELDNPLGISIIFKKIRKK